MAMLATADGRPGRAVPAPKRDGGHAARAPPRPKIAAWTHALRCWRVCWFLAPSAAGGDWRAGRFNRVAAFLFRVSRPQSDTRVQRPGVTVSGLLLPRT